MRYPYFTAANIGNMPQQLRIADIFAPNGRAFAGFAKQPPPQKCSPFLTIDATGCWHPHPTSVVDVVKIGPRLPR
jgi:hypothetical protein